MGNPRGAAASHRRDVARFGSCHRTGGFGRSNRRRWDGDAERWGPLQTHGRSFNGLSRPWSNVDRGRAVDYARAADYARAVDYARGWTTGRACSRARRGSAPTGAMMIHMCPSEIFFRPLGEMPRGSERDWYAAAHGAGPLRPRQVCDDGSSLARFLPVPTSDGLTGRAGWVDVMRLRRCAATR